MKLLLTFAVILAVCAFESEAVYNCKRCSNLILYIQKFGGHFKKDINKQWAAKRLNHCMTCCMRGNLPENYNWEEPEADTNQARQECWDWFSYQRKPLM